MNRLGDRLPVERLPERSRARIERAVLAALDADAAREPAPAPAPRSRRAAWLAGPAVLAAAAALAVVVTRAPEPRPARPVTSLRAGGATQERVLLAGAAIEVAAGAALVVSGDDDDGYLVVLERGRADFQVGPRAGRPPFVVQAGAVRVEVVGTRFAVDRFGDQARVDVVEGRVRVRAPAVDTQVGPGERWPAEAAEALPLPAADDDDHGIEIGPVETPAVDDGAPRRRRDKPVRPPRSAGEPRGEVAPAAPAPADLPDARARFSQAAALETRDPEAALRGYRAVAAGEGPWAANALFAASRLELERGRVAAARTLLEAYARRFPRGPNREDVRLLLERHPAR
jgi:transmembrane sensor